MLVATDGDAPSELGEAEDAPHEPGVAAPVVDHAGRLVDEVHREVQDAAERRAVAGDAGHQATARRAG